MSELTSERLDELEREATLHRNLNIPYKDALRLRTPLWPDEALALIAMAKRTHQAERERDVLLEAVAQLGQHSMSYRDFNGDDYVHCIVCEGRMELEGHRSNCRLQRLFALAEPTGATAPHTNDAAPAIRRSQTENMWDARCDWGYCDGICSGFRWCSDLEEFLPVCNKHLTGPHRDKPTGAGGDA